MARTAPTTPPGRTIWTRAHDPGSLRSKGVAATKVQSMHSGPGAERASGKRPAQPAALQAADLRAPFILPTPDWRYRLGQLREILPRVGVTRLANVTHLDRIGLPVAMAVRPNARSVSVAMGKARSLADAQASAAMEAIEGFQAETAQPTLRGIRWWDLPSAQRLDSIDLLPLIGAGRFDRDLRLDWSNALDLTSGRSLSVPFALVHTDYTRPMCESGLWPGSNGLASGTSRYRAMVAAICEIIERDAIARWLNRGSRERQRCRIDLESVDDPHCDEVIERFRNAGMTVCCWDITTDIGIPVFACRLIDEVSQDEGGIGPVRGAGCHLQPGIALLRALTEAAQIRLTYIVGARDDLIPYEYSTGEKRGFVAWAEERVAETMPPIPFESGSDLPDDPLAELLSRLTMAGNGEVIAIDLTGDEIGIPTVRAIVPGMGGLTPSGKYHPGRRVIQEGRAAQ